MLRKSFDQTSLVLGFQARSLNILARQANRKTDCSFVKGLVPPQSSPVLAPGESTVGGGLGRPSGRRQVRILCRADGMAQSYEVCVLKWGGIIGYQWVSHHIHSCSRSPKGVQRHSKDILADEFPEGHTLLIMLSQAYTYTIYTSLDMVYSKPGFSAIERWHPRRQFVERATQAPNIRAWPSPPNSWAKPKMPSCFTFNRFRRYGQKQQHFHAVKWPKE